MTAAGLALCAQLGVSRCDLSAISMSTSFDNLFGCPITLLGSITNYCPPPADMTCRVVATFSSRAYPNGVVYFCRKEIIPSS